jgi:hypothetical protein
VMDLLAGQHPPVHLHVLRRRGVATRVVEEHTVAARFVAVPPTTTLTSTRPRLRRSSVAVMRAAAVGETTPGRTATRKRSFSVTEAIAPATTHGSSHERPVGTNTP